MKIKGLDFPLKSFFISIFGNSIYLVGGTVRDFLLYKKITGRDIDLIVTQTSYDEIEKKLKKHGKTNTVGKSFAVVKFSKEGFTFDISVPRRDFRIDQEKTSHKNFVIESGSHISLEQDLKRRDFTCNSIAMRLADDLLIDPYQGVAAINEKILAMTDPRYFFEDPLRILRAARFASVHKFKVEEDIYVRSKKVELNGLSSERITEELFRLILESDLPSRALHQYFKLSVLEKLFPEINQLMLTIQDSLFHPETDEFGHHTVGIHTFITVDICRKLARLYNLGEAETISLVLAALLHDVGKGSTTRWEFKNSRMTITSVLHDSLGTKMAKSILMRLKIDSKNNFPLRDTILTLIKNHHRIYDLYRNRAEIGYRAISRLVNDLPDQDFLLVLLDFADRRSRAAKPLQFTKLDRISKWYLQKKEELNINKDTVKPVILGRDLLNLGIPPGRKMGFYLKKLHEMQLDGVFSSKKQGLKIFEQELRK